MNPMLLTIILPLAGAFFIFFIPKKLSGRFSTAVLGGTFLCSILTLSYVFKGRELSFTRAFSDWFNLSFTADPLGVFMAAVSSFVALLISFYSLEYMEHYQERNDFFFWVVLFVGSMMGLVFSANLILLFCFWEMTSVCSWKLIGFYRQDKDLKAADKAFLVTFFGASLMLAGIVLIYINYGTTQISALKGFTLNNLAAVLLLCGIISKSAQLPLQSWLPDAGVAPAPVTALLHAAVLVKIGVFMFARVFSLTFFTSPLFLNLCVNISVITILVAAGSALVENNIKKILAYSTISQLGYMLLALSLNTAVSLKVALIYILAHSLAKCGLFLCAGIIEQKCRTKDINELGGLIKTMPRTAIAYILCAFSVIGIPPLLGFWPKFLLILLTLKQGYILAGSISVFAALLTLFYLMRLFNKVFLGPVKVQAAEDSGSIMVWVVLALGVLSLVLGAAFNLPFGFISTLLK